MRAQCAQYEEKEAACQRTLERARLEMEGAAAALICPQQRQCTARTEGPVHDSIGSCYSAEALRRSAEWRKECEALDASIRQLREQVGRATHGTAPMV